MAHTQLSRGAIRAIVAGTDVKNPILQCIGIKPLKTANPNDVRYQVALSDSESWQKAILSNQIAELVRNEEIKVGSIVRAEEYILNLVQNKKLLVVLGASLVGFHGETLGDPREIDPASLHTQPAVVAGGEAADARPFKQARTQPGPYGGPQPSAYGAPPPAYGTPHTSASAYGAPPQQQASAYAAPLHQASAYGAPGPTANGHLPFKGEYGRPGGAPYASNGGAYGAPPAGPRSASYGAPASNPYGAPQGGRGPGAGPSSAYGGPGAQPGPVYRVGNNPIVHNVAPARIVPINSLNAYQNKWTIKARVTQKSDVRRWSNVRGEGKLFSFDLLDADKGEIRVVAFQDQCDKFYDVIQVGQIITLSKASLKPKRGNFNSTRHEFEINLEKSSEIEICSEDDDTAVIPSVQYFFRRIEEIESEAAGTVLDVVGVAESCQDVAVITRKDGTETQKRACVIKDTSNRSIEVTLWGNYADSPGAQVQQMINSGENPVLAIKSARVGDYNGKSLSTIGSSIVEINPQVAETAELRNWYDNGGGAQLVANPLSEGRGGGGGGGKDRRVTFAHIKDEQLGTGAPAYIQINGWITFIRGENMYYPACTLQFNGKTCHKKVVQNQDETWWCERCGANSQPDWRYMLSLTASDFTGNQWLTAFQDQGQDILGTTAAELKSREGTPAHDAVIQRSSYQQLLFKLKVAEDTYGDETRIKASIMRVDPVDFVRESKTVLGYLRKLHLGEPIMQGLPAGGDAAAGGNGRGGGTYPGGPGTYMTTPGAASAAVRSQPGGYGNGGFGAGGPGGAGGFGAGGGGYGGPRGGGGGGGYGNNSLPTNGGSYGGGNAWGGGVLF